MVHLANNKKLIAEAIGLNRKNIYYETKQEKKDLEVKNQIEAVQVDNPAYGHRRIALDLKMNKKKILRVMNKYGIKPLRRRIRFFKTRDRKLTEIDVPNLVKLMCPIRPDVIWVCDFTYIRFKGRFIYLASVEDIFTREILGLSISRFHNSYLVIEALEEALSTGRKPMIGHSDQGSEYRSEKYQKLLKDNSILCSMSAKGSPWENGYQESFFGRLKEESGDLNRFEDLPKLIEYIYLQVHYYNYKRIHTKLKMSPKQYYSNLLRIRS